MADSNRDPRSEVDDEITGLPALRSWRAVYLFVLGTFIVWVVLLTVLSRAFS